TSSSLIEPLTLISSNVLPLRIAFNIS
ncbi:hypothetical protein D030_3895B, partial [Vibrio parahaemolyticus AQ3810]